MGSSQREDNLDLLLERIKEHNLPEEVFDWYLDLGSSEAFRIQGFGMGLERMVSWICNLEHIRKTIPFARRPNRIRP